MGSFPMLVGYFLDFFPKSVVIVSCFMEIHSLTLSIFSPLTAALHVVDFILNFFFLHCGYLGALVYYLISSKHWHLENLSYMKKQQEQAEARNKQYHQSINNGSLF